MLLARGGGLRKVVFTGFGATPDNPSPDALLNNFALGFDNRIHGGAAGIGGVITSVGGRALLHYARSRRFSFDRGLSPIR